ncbi:MAG: tetratricopeptide repeat protein [Betaproteobacteria bacterium]|nr:tetratricopeptide repeat protein [Betaproteobacteria bacterium]
MFNLEEQEQIDALKAWWKRYGNWVSLAFLAVALAVAGTQGWNIYQNRQASRAAVLFANLEAFAQAGDVHAVRQTAGTLMAHYRLTAYASRAALIAAAANDHANDTRSAAAQLHWVLDHTSEAPLRAVARLRLAGLLLDEKHYRQAQQLLAAGQDKAYASLYHDLEGDVAVAAGNVAAARTAYQAALQGKDEDATFRAFVQDKLDALGGTK